MSEGEREECSLHAIVETLKLPKMLTVRNEYLLNEKCVLYKGQKIVLLQHELVKLLFGTDWFGKEFRINTYKQANLHIDIVEAVYPKDLGELKSLLPNINYILPKPQYECDYAAAKNGEELKFDTGENFDDINDITLTTILDKKISVSLEVLLDKKYFVFVHLKERLSLQMFLLIRNVFPQIVRFLNISDYQMPAGVVILQGLHVYNTILTVTKNQHNHAKLTYEMFQLDSRIEVSISKEYLPKYVLSLGDYHSKSYRNKINKIKSAMHFNIYSSQFYGDLVADKPSQNESNLGYTRRHDSVDWVSPPKSLTGLMKKWKSCSILEENESPPLRNGKKKRRPAFKNKGKNPSFSQSEKYQIKDDILTFPIMNKNQRLSPTEGNIIQDNSNNTLCNSLDEKTLSSMMSKEDFKTEKDLCDKIVPKMEYQMINKNLAGFETNIDSSVGSPNSKENIECDYKGSENQNDSDIFCEQCSNPLCLTKNFETSKNDSFDLNNNSSQEKHEICINNKKQVERSKRVSDLGLEKRQEYKINRKEKSKSESFLNLQSSSVSSYYTSIIYADVQGPRIFSNDLQKHEIYSIEKLKLFSIEQVGQVLNTLKLSKYKDSFKKQLINGQLLFNLSEEAFREMKLTHFEARKLYKYVHGWRVNTKNCGSSLQETPINYWSVKDVISVMEKINLKKLKVFIKENDVDGCLLKDIIDNGILKTLEKDYGIHLILVEQERLQGYLNNTLIYNENS